MKIELLAAGDFLIAAFSLTIAAIQLWMLRTRQSGYGAAAAISLAVAAYAIASGLNLQFADASDTRQLYAGSYLALVALVFATPTFTASLAKQPLPPVARLRIPVDVAWALLILFTPLVVGNDVEITSLSLLSHPFVHPGSGPLVPVFFASLITEAGLAAVWLWRHRAPGDSVALWFTLAIGLWVTAGAVDSATALGVFARPPMFILQYVFFAFAIGIFAMNYLEHVALLDGRIQLNLEQAQGFRALVEESSEYIVVQHAGVVVYANAAILRALGFDDDTAIIGRPTVDLVHPADRNRVLVRQRVLSTGTRPSVTRMRMLCHDGTTRIVDVNASIGRFGGRSALVLVARDMTERLRLDAHLMQVDRMAAVGSLAAGVCHELNNPLTFVLGNLHLIRQDLHGLATAAARGDLKACRSNATELLTSLDDALEGGQRVAAVVRDLSAMSRSGPTRMTTVDLRPVIESSARLATNELRNRATLTLDLPELADVRGDPGRLGQVFLNLLVNAAQSFDYGDVGRHRVTVSASSSASEVAVTVSDNGVGISPLVLPRIFDAFVTTKAIGHGTGLGLAICQRVIEDHGGTLSVESEEGVGSTFTVTLPVAGTGIAAVPPVQLDGTGFSPPRTDKTLPCVLVVDDEEAIVTAIVRSLRGRWRCIGVSTVRAALAALEEDASVDLVLADLLMPDQTGWQLQDELADRWPRLARRLVFMTGGLLNTGMEDFLSGPGVSWIAKPLDLADLPRQLQLKLDEINQATGTSDV